MWCNTYFYYIQFCGDVCVCVVWCPVNQLCDAARKSRNVSLSLSLRSHKLGKNHFSAIKIQEVTGFLVYCHHMFAPTARRGTRFLIDAIEAKLSAKLQDGSIAFPDSLPHTQRYITILFGRCAMCPNEAKLSRTIFFIFSQMISIWKRTSDTRCLHSSPLLVSFRILHGWLFLLRTIEFLTSLV